MATWSCDEAIDSRLDGLSFFRRISVEPGQDPFVLAPDDLERLAAECDLIMRSPLQKE